MKLYQILADNSTDFSVQGKRYERFVAASVVEKVGYTRFYFPLSNGLGLTIKM